MEEKEYAHVKNGPEAQQINKPDARVDRDNRIRESKLNTKDISTECQQEFYEANEQSQEQNEKCKLYEYMRNKRNAKSIPRTKRGVSEENGTNEHPKKILKQITENRGFPRKETQSPIQA